MENVNKRMIVTRYGGQGVLRLVEEPLRKPGVREIRVKVESAGVALADIMRREGVYPASPKPPFTPGYDAVGTVDECGSDVRQFAKGDRVGVFFAGTGGYAAYVYADAEEVVRVPPAVDSAQAAAVLLNYVTAYQMLHRLAMVSEGDRILVHGASGGVGSALLELGRHAKVKMFGTASAAKHGLVADYGATPIDYRSEDFVAVIAKLAPKGVDAVFDPIGGANWHRSFQTLSPEGRFVGYGFTSALSDGEQSSWADDWRALSVTSHTPAGNPAFLYSITSLRKERPDWYKEDAAVLLSMLEQGAIQPVVSHRIPLEEAAYAHQLLESSSSVGKVVLVCS